MDIEGQVLSPGSLVCVSMCECVPPCMLRPKLKLCLFHLTLPTHQNSPYPNNFIAIFSCKVFFFLISKDRICIAKAVPMQAGLKFVLVLFIVLFELFKTVKLIISLPPVSL